MKPENKLDLEQLLAQRTAPPNNPDFVRNILQQAHLTPQKISFWQEVQLLLKSYLPVKPAPLVATVLSIGFLFGTGYEALNSNHSTNEMTSIQTMAIAESHYGYSL